MTVKRLAILTASLAALFAFTGGVAAFAENAETDDTLSGAETEYTQAETAYPQNEDFYKSLAFTALYDYALNGEIYAFADNGDGDGEGAKIIVYDDGELTVYDVAGKITALDCDSETFYYSVKSDDPDQPDPVYTLDGNEAEHTFSFDERITANGFMYYFNNENDGKFTVYNLGTMEAIDYEETFTQLKQYGGKVYAISGNALCVFEGAQYEKIEQDYLDYSVAENIATGTAAQSLVEGYALAFVAVEEGAFMTEVDLSQVGDTFNADGSAKTVRAQENTVALLLCTTGNASIVAIGDTSYITLTSGTQAAQFEYAEASEFTSATVTGNRIYASPFVVAGTSVVEPAYGTVVEVVHKLVYDGVLGYEFYEVLYDGDKTGYVAAGFLTEYIFEDNREPSEIPDEQYSEENAVRTVLLILAVVVLVLIAVGYLTYTATGGRKNKNKQHDNTEEN